MGTVFDNTTEVSTAVESIPDVCMAKADNVSPEAKSTPDVDVATANNSIIYDFCGILLHARQGMIKCNDCWKTLQTTKDKVPKKFMNSGLVAIRDRGGLKWGTEMLFQTIKAVEQILDEHFESGDGYVRDSFERVIDKLKDLKFPPICCDKHRSVLVPKLLLEYVVIRYRFKGRHYNNNELSNKTAKRHSKMKQSKLV